MKIRDLKLESVDLINDINYTDKYANLYAESEEKVFPFEYKEGDFIFKNMAIKRPITKIGNQICHEGYYDLETPYGYGGFYSNNKDMDFNIRALDKYKEHCKNQNIIAEFIRFHPFNTYPDKFKNFLDMCNYDRDVVVLDLSLSNEDRWKQYSKTTRNILRRCNRQLIFNKTYDIKTFTELYYETMSKNKADKFYFFEKNYFLNLLNLDGVYLYEANYEGNAIAMSFFVYTKTIAYYYLSANKESHVKLNANYFILDNAFKEAKNRKIKFLL